MGLVKRCKHCGLEFFNSDSDEPSDYCDKCKDEFYG